MLRLIFALAISFIVAVGLGSVAHSAPQCNKRDNVLELLAKKYKETPVAIGVTNTGGLVELLTAKNGSWTIILTTPRGMSCLAATGEGWYFMDETTTEPAA